MFTSCNKNVLFDLDMQQTMQSIDVNSVNFHKMSSVKKNKRGTMKMYTCFIAFKQQWLCG